MAEKRVPRRRPPVIERDGKARRSVTEPSPIEALSPVNRQRLLAEQEKRKQRKPTGHKIRKKKSR